ncbi:TetR/AcrR family transcriptional regulator [Rheinheimera sp. YQF-2]|uniref:TetR/AcrR family transcriptional regulator n=1 Tax=Rheinheimera lutimaris TaxID=2740584 RepID=A0A7Y5AN25_9GAMM|nr:TetR/AcrR family transcriptional regulator [Rheinheimera lutimaris]NRQ41396.1 TetR/AcrR family transcriptional regulator [Rheinheimera lutimaris]
MQQQILDTALQLASKTGWEQLTLQQLAAAMQISLADIYCHFRTKDELVDAWFDRADMALLSAQISKELPAATRLQQAIQHWLAALAPYHKLSSQMLLYKLEPGHIHLQFGGILRISRTVQWLREAAGLTASGVARIGQELALSSLFVVVFVYWLKDRSPAQQRSLRLLQRKLQCADIFGLWR